MNREDKITSSSGQCMDNNMSGIVVVVQGLELYGQLHVKMNQGSMQVQKIITQMLHTSFRNKQQ